jgi:hypothetical protein
MTVGGDGEVTVTGGFLGGDGNWRRRGVSFAVAPVADGGVRLRFNATAGGRFAYDVAFEAGYASDAEPKLVRARLALRAAADGPLDVTVGPG